MGAHSIFNCSNVSTKISTIDIRMKVVEVFAVAGAFVVAVVAAEQQQQQLHTKQADDLTGSDSSVHYSFGHAYGHQVSPHGHHANGYAHSYGHHSAHGYGGYGEHGYENHHAY